ncbi:MAG TPA: hypothetical protein VJH94_05465 [Candidatus Paceibacterota bacterium]
MSHFNNLIALIIKDWRERDHKNRNLPKNGGQKFGGWLGGSQRASALIADRVEEMHKDPRPYGKDDTFRCSLYLLTDDQFVKEISAYHAAKAAEELTLFLSLPRRAREVVLSCARTQYASKEATVCEVVT